MKIEMGESLFYSWLRHVKDCQIVQTNWKVSTQWNLQHELDLNALLQNADKHFSNKYGIAIFKKNTSLSQILKQGECDVIGISIQDGITNFYTVDVAFHENGLQYGGRTETVAKVIAKTIRTAMCLWGYMECKEAEIIFASPKINPAVINDILPCIDDINMIFSENHLHFKARIIANDDFNDLILQPILLVSENVADTSELFMRSYQLFHMFSHHPQPNPAPLSQQKISQHQPNMEEPEKYRELKVGKLARSILGRILEGGSISIDELTKLQTSEYSKEKFDLQYPLLVKQGTQFETIRYYTQPIKIFGEYYYLCSQWFETPANNDRPYLLQWIAEHE